MTVKMLLNSPFYKIITEVTKMMITMIKMALLKTTMTKIVLPIFAIFFFDNFFVKDKVDSNNNENLPFQKTIRTELSFDRRLARI